MALQSTSEIEQKAAATNKVKSNSDDFARKMAYLNAPDNPEMDMFRFMDKDHDGFVSAEDLVAYFEEENSGSISAQTVASLEALVVEADSDGAFSHCPTTASAQRQLVLVGSS